MASYPSLSHRRLYLYSVYLILYPPSSWELPVGGIDDLSSYLTVSPHLSVITLRSFNFFLSDTSNTLSVENIVVPPATQRILLFFFRWQGFFPPESFVMKICPSLVWRLISSSLCYNFLSILYCLSPHRASLCPSFSCLVCCSFLLDHHSFFCLILLFII